MLNRWRARREQARRRRAAEEAMRRAGRLPPGQRLTQKFPVLHVGRIPPFDEATWRFRIWGEVERPLALTWGEFQALPRTTLVCDIHCVTQWSKFGTTWEGVAPATLVDLGLLRPTGSARFVLQVAAQGYTTNLPLETILQPNFLLATHFEGRPLTPEHGFPLRGVIGHIPGRRDLTDVYFWKGAKWLEGLHFVARDQPGTWERGGYHNEGHVWAEERWGRRF